MTKVKIINLIQDDLSGIKTELFENSEVFIQNLIGTLARTIKNPFSAYKLDLSLNYLKLVYESVFPYKKHGGTRISKAKEAEKLAQKSFPEQVELNSTWVKSVPLVDRVIVINLFKGIRHVKKVPSFSELIGMRSELSSRIIRSKIRVGNYIANCIEVNRSIVLFRSNKITHTKFLEIIIEEEKKREKKRKKLE